MQKSDERLTVTSLCCIIAFTQSGERDNGTQIEDAATTEGAQEADATATQVAGTR